jgi:hypothetical protein
MNSTVGLLLSTIELSCARMKREGLRARNNSFVILGFFALSCSGRDFGARPATGSLSAFMCRPGGPPRAEMKPSLGEGATGSIND